MNWVREVLRDLKVKRGSAVFRAYLVSKGLPASKVQRAHPVCQAFRGLRVHLDCPV